MEQKRQNKIYMFFIIILSILLAGSFLLGLLGIYDGYNEQSLTNMQVEDVATIQIDGVGAYVFSFNLNGSLLAGESLKNKILIKNNTEKELSLRAKLDVFSEDGIDPILIMQTTQDWIKQADGYYLFNDFISSLSTISLLTGLKIGEGQQMKSDNKYIVVITVESLPSSVDRTQIWGY